MNSKLEALSKAKIPCAETGVEIHKSICDICTPGSHCGLDVYVKDGMIIKIEGTEGFPGSNGKLCTKGASNRQFVYQENRIRTPMRRTGPRGSGEFEPISWEEAYREIGDKLNAIKRISGPEAVCWYTGYTKWYRTWLHRLAYSFGSRNYGTESSCCFKATQMAWMTVTGRNYRPDMRNASVFLGWACNTLINLHIQGRELMEFKERGGKIIIVDPRVTETSRKLADIHLQLKPGTDGALALGLANLIIQRGWYDKEYVRAHTYGFEEYASYAAEFTPERTAAITGVPADLLEKAARLYATSGPAASYTSAAAVTHHINGYNNYRALVALQAICGNIDRKGGMLPIHTSLAYTDCGFPTNEAHFIHDKEPKNCREAIGARRFPVWEALAGECQAMDLPRQIETCTPYPLKALVGFGLNHRMWPQPSKFLKAVDKLDFIVAIDLVTTEFTKHADILLPACTSMERSELKGYPGGFLTCTKPAIEPLYESKSDTQIMCELAQYLDIDDDLMKSGLRATMEYLIEPLSVSLDELMEAPLPLRMKEFKPYIPGTYTKNGFETKTGKLELKSAIIEEISKDYPDLNPLPTYHDSCDGADPKQFPCTLITGARLPNAVHSRLHSLTWPRSLRPDPAADLNPETARESGIAQDDWIVLSTSCGQITVRANLTHAAKPGEVYMYHGYPEADVNELIPADHLDPYSGFPGFKQVRCRVEKAKNIPAARER